MVCDVGKQRKKILKNLICAVYCSVELGIVLLAFGGLEYVEEKLHPASADLPVIKGEVLVLDEDSALEENRLTVCIDAGHGGKDNGSDYRMRYEKNDNLKISQAVAAYLAERDVQVIMTRNDDTFLSLEERTRFANEKKADYFISLHRNDGDGNGVETWIGSNAGRETQDLAENIMQGLSAVGIQRNRGVKKGTQKSGDKDYYVNLHTTMPACIVELGFINSTADNQLFDEHLQEYAKAIGDAVLSTHETHETMQEAAEENVTAAG